MSNNSDNRTEADVGRESTELAGPPLPLFGQEEDRIPERIGKFRILDLLAPPAMALVYKAEQDNPKRTVVLKIPRGGQLTSREVRERFLREVALAARLQHPAIIPVLEAGEIDGTPFYTMPYIEGRSLSDHLTAEKPGLTEKIALFEAACEVVQALHAEGLVHRDLKPDNLLVDRYGKVRLLDFGLAKAVEEGDTTGITGDQVLLGTPRYMAPEQTLPGQRNAISPATDVYALGVILCRLLTGEYPYALEGSPFEVLQQIRKVEPTPPRTVNPEVPAHLSDTAMACLRKSPADRPQNAGALLGVLHGTVTEPEAIPQEWARAEIPEPMTSEEATPTGMPVEEQTAAGEASPPARWRPVFGVVAIAAVALGIACIAGWIVFEAQNGGGDGGEGTTGGGTNDQVQFQQRVLQNANASAAMIQQQSPDLNTVGAQVTQRSGDPRMGRDWTLDLGDGEEMVLKWIPPGRFAMGSTPDEREWAAGPEGQGDAKLYRNEGDPALVQFDQGFWLGSTEVTVRQWKRFVAETGYKTEAEDAGQAWCLDRNAKRWTYIKGGSWRNPNYESPVDDAFPVVCVSWTDGMAYCSWQAQRQREKPPPGYTYRLPGEAEWEYACRGGREGTRFWWGNFISDGEGRLNAASRDTDSTGGVWTRPFPWSDGFMFVSAVDQYGGKGRNGFGLADMLGNVWEWCYDSYDVRGGHATIWLGESERHVRRGGSFDNPPGYVRCAFRGGCCQPGPGAGTGFRVCLGPAVP